MATITKVSPLAPDRFPDMPVVPGVRFATTSAGVKYEGRDDVMLALLQPGSTVAGVFTRSSTRAAPVLDCQAKLGGTQTGPAAILVNSGNANAFTGRHGVESVEAITAAVEAVTGVAQRRVFTSSTGVIGEPLPHDRITQSLDALNADAAPEKIEAAARAIMTTDTYAKGAAAQVDIEGQRITLAGIAKGSGMIAPDMATMLVYIFTDAQISFDLLQSYVQNLNAVTFNRITVDSDTSTSDTLLAAATGASGIDIDAASAQGQAAFAGALEDVMLDLAHQVVRDGEGATKFVTIDVGGAATAQDADLVARAIANSPLVKTAIAGEDPNWGRIVMAVGKSGAKADRDKLSIRFGDILVAEKGWVAPAYKEEDGAAYMQQENITIGVDLGLGTMVQTIWTCDLTHDYISINADYRS